MDWTDHYDALQIELEIALSNKQLRAIVEQLQADEDTKFQELGVKLANEGKTLVESLFED